MKLTNLLKIALKALLRNKTRALLTMLGIIIGIASVIAMVSIGQSSTIGIGQEISSMGSNMIMVMPGTQQRGPVNTGAGTSKNLTIADVEAIKKSPYIAQISPIVSTSGQLVNGSNNWRGTISGGNEHYLEIRNYTLESGVPFSNQDVRAATKVCIIGKTIQDKLFPNGESPVGKTIRFNKTPFTVIGILESKGKNTMGMDQDDVVIAPYTTVQKRLLAITHIQSINISAINEESVDLAIADITRTLRGTRKIEQGGEDDFSVTAQKEMLDMMSSIMGMLTVLLAAIAAISLIVGGIGIMNIMYVTVTERIKEIGLRMAIGAQNRDVLLQFLAESAILSLIGGIIGIIIGLGLSFVASYFLNWPFVVSGTTVAISFFVCVAIGIFFGWYPAKKASNLDPITALRYE
jgi:putative ABC transport system permease protein